MIKMLKWAGKRLSHAHEVNSGVSLDPQSGLLLAHSGVKQQVAECNQMPSSSHSYHRKNKYTGCNKISFTMVTYSREMLICAQPTTIRK
jgi:hypothetical protein